MIPKTLSLLLAASSLLAVQSEGAAVALYGVGLAFGGNAPTTFTIDRTTGDATPVGPVGSQTAQLYGLAVRAGGLYTFDASTDTIRMINPDTGAFSGPALSIGIGNLSGEGDIAFSLDGNTGYITTANMAGGSSNDISPALYSFNLTAGTSALIGTTRDALGPLTVDGLAVNPANGLIYALTDADTQLYTLNPATGFLTPVGELGVTPNSGFGALTFDPGTGTLYGAINDGLYTVDPATGAATPIPAGGAGGDVGSLSGLAVVPEPATFGLLGLGFLGLLTRRARRAR